MLQKLMKPIEDIYDQKAKKKKGKNMIKKNSLNLEVLTDYN